MKPKTHPVRKNTEASKLAEASVLVGASRRKFLKQSVAFAALTASYSVISLTDLACRSSVGPPGPGTLGAYYFGGNDYYFGGEDYFSGDEYFGGSDYYWGYGEYYWSEPFFLYY
ncbi:MAG TPA: hypothetical protein VFH95_06110 [Candidatus Kapabacteria bacterium]|nr:hypothetical protein [Candidatus Kapabacteria bacterium]